MDECCLMGLVKWDYVIQSIGAGAAVEELLKDVGVAVSGGDVNETSLESGTVFDVGSITQVAPHLVDVACLRGFHYCRAKHHLNLNASRSSTSSFKRFCTAEVISENNDDQLSRLMDAINVRGRLEEPPWHERAHVLGKFSGAPVRLLYRIFAWYYLPLGALVVRCLT